MKEKDVQKYFNQPYWYHATTLESLESILENGVKADYNVGRPLDFGYGFYLTPKLNQAISYIKRTGPYLVNDVTKTQFVVIVFELDLSKLINHYTLKLLPHYDREFSEFVFECRMNPDKQIHPYDMILGVMSDNNPTQLIKDYRKKLISKSDVLTLLQKWTSMEQLSLHNQEICDILLTEDIICLDDI